MKNKPIRVVEGKTGPKQTEERNTTMMFPVNSVKGLVYRKRKKIYSNSTGTNTFYPEEMKAYSYRWWCYLRKIKGKVVFNAYSYSPTTRCHQSDLQDLLRKLKVKIDVTVEVASGLQNFECEALEPVYERMFQLEIDMKRKGANKVKNQARLSYIKGLKDEIALLRSLGAKFSLKKQSDLKKRLDAREEQRLSEMKAQAKTRSTERMIKEVNQFELVI